MYDHCSYKRDRMRYMLSGDRASVSGVQLDYWSLDLGLTPD